MVTRLTSDMVAVLSEYPLAPDEELRKEGDALWIAGIGVIGQYHSYYNELWEKGTLYFCRDYYLNQLETVLENGKERRDSNDVILNINILNSKIRLHESCQE